MISNFGNLSSLIVNGERLCCVILYISVCYLTHSLLLLTASISCHNRYQNDDKVKVVKKMKKKNLCNSHCQPAKTELRRNDSAT